MASPARAPAAAYGPAGRHACLRGLAELTVDAVRPRRGERCIDLCDATAALLAHLARAVGREGEVLALTTGGAAARSVAEEVEVRGLAPPVRPRRVRRDQLRRLPAAAVAVSLLGLAASAEPAAALAGLLGAVARHPGGRLACAVWDGEAGAPHEAALQRGLVAATGRRSAVVDRLLRLGLPGAAEELVAALRDQPLPVTVRRVGDVARFDGVDHCLAVLAGERPAVLAGARLPAAARGRMRGAVAEALAAHTLADGSLRIPVAALVLVAGQPPPTTAW